MVPSRGSTIQRCVASSPSTSAALLHQEAVAGARLGQLLPDDVLGLVVGGRDEVRGTLDGDLKLLDLAEVARERAARLAGCRNHHVHQGGGGHSIPTRVRARGADRGCDDLTAPGGSGKRAIRRLGTYAYRVSCFFSRQSWAAFSAFARSASGRAATMRSSLSSVTPPALAMRRHLAASVVSRSTPAPSA